MGVACLCARMGVGGCGGGAVVERGDTACVDGS